MLACSVQGGHFSPSLNSHNVKILLLNEIPFSFEDQYVITNEGDRFDILANQYYDDSSLWWVISIANRELNQNSYYITPGTQIRMNERKIKLCSRKSTAVKPQPESLIKNGFPNKK